MTTLDLVRDNAIMQNGRNTGGRARGSSGGTRAAASSPSLQSRRVANMIRAGERNIQANIDSGTNTRGFPGSGGARDMANANRAARGLAPRETVNAARATRRRSLARAGANTAGRSQSGRVRAQNDRARSAVRREVGAERTRRNESRAFARQFGI